MAQKLDRIWVAPEFKTLIKIEAAKKGMSIAKLTKELIKKGDCMDKLAEWDGKVKRVKKRGFDFP